MMKYHGISWYPAQWSAGLAAVLAAVVAFGFLSQTAASYVSTIGVGVIGLVTAFLARPWDLAVIGGLVTSVLTGVAGFGLNLTDVQIAAVVGVLTLALGWFNHTQLTPRAGSPYALDPGLPTPPGLAAPTKLAA